MKHTKIIILCLFISLFGTKTFAQLKSSIYTGIGTVTNLGGIFGIGSEVKYKSVSFSAAMGLEYILEHEYSIDIGIKLYSKHNIFGGINFGYCKSPYPIYGPTNNFTFSLGYRRTIYKHLYGLGYLGATSDYWAFMPKEDRKHDLLLRLGLIIGYEF